MELVVGASEATMKSLLAKLGGLLAQEYTLIRGVNGDLQYINDELATMQSFLRELATVSRGNSHGFLTKDWMKQIRDLTYDIEDCIDDSAHRLHGLRTDMCCYFLVNSVHEVLTWWPRRDLAMKISTLKMRAQQISERRHRYGVDNPRGSGPEGYGSAAIITAGFDAADNQGTSLQLVAVKDPVGVEEDMEELEKWVTDREHKDSVLYIVGFGGVGKTTIATALYRKLGDRFDHRAMVTVSQSSDLEAILTNIKSQVMPQFRSFHGQQPGTAENPIITALGRLRRATLSTVMAAKCCSTGASEETQFRCARSWATLRNNCELQGSSVKNRLGVALGHVKRGTSASMIKCCSVGTAEKMQPGNNHEQQDSSPEKRPGIVRRVRRGTSAVRAKCCGTSATGETQWERFDHPTVFQRNHEQRGSSSKGCTLASAVKGVRDCVSRGTSAVMAVCPSAGTSKETRDGTKLDQLKKDLMEHLEEKSYLILIDDVWSATMWDQIRKSLPQSKERRRIIVTTRFQAVATTFREERDHTRRVNPLGVKESEKLFKQAFSESKGNVNATTSKREEGHHNVRTPNGEKPLELSLQLFPEFRGTKDVTVPEEVWKLCGGLPLAIVTMAGHVACNPNKSHVEWFNLCRSLFPESGKDHEKDGGKELTQEEVGRIVSHCYNDMSAEIKTCSLYLSIFPKGGKISRKRLTRRWLAEGFVSEKQGLSAEDVAETYFNHLIRRKIIRPVEHSSNGKVKKCIVHDMVLEHIVAKASEENFITVVGGNWLIQPPSSKVRRLSLQGSDSKRAKDIEKMNLSHVRSLTMFGSLNQIPSSLFKFGIVQVLDLEGCIGLKVHHTEEICKMLLLKYLSLRKTDTKMLPDMIRKLENLETLDVRQTEVIELPNTVCQLERLVNILGGDKRTRKALKLPEELKSKKKMKALRILSGIEIVGGSADFHHLTELRKLAIYKLKTTRNDASFEDLSSSIEYLGGYSLQTLTIDDQSAEFLKSLDALSTPPKFLVALELSGKMVRLPRWVRELSALKKLTLSVTALRTDNLRDLSNLEALFSLTFSLSSGAKKRDRETLTIHAKNKLDSGGEIKVPAGGFRSLKLLRFSAPLLPLLSFSKDAVPELQRLELRFSMLEGLFGTENLEKLEMVHLTLDDKDGEPMVKEIQLEMESAIKRIGGKMPRMILDQ